MNEGFEHGDGQATVCHACARVCCASLAACSVRHVALQLYAARSGVCWLHAAVGSRQAAYTSEISAGPSGAASACTAPPLTD
jgi:hypothetical protein